MSLLPHVCGFSSETCPEPPAGWERAALARAGAAGTLHPYHLHLLSGSPLLPSHCNHREGEPFYHRSELLMETAMWPSSRTGEGGKLDGNCGGMEGFPGGMSSKEPACQCRRPRRCGLDPWVGKIPRRRAQQPTPVFLPGEPHGQRDLVGCSHGVAKSQTGLSMHAQRVSHRGAMTEFFPRTLGLYVCCLGMWVYIARTYTLARGAGNLNLYVPSPNFSFFYISSHFIFSLHTSLSDNK